MDASESKYLKKDKTNNNNKYFKYSILRVLLSIILVISVLISFKLDESNKEFIKKYVFTENLKFTKINKWYQDNIGKIIPSGFNKATTVFSSKEILLNKNEKYKDGIKIFTENDTLVSSICGGIVVYVGDKDDYGNSVIVQGNDGVDYLYGNLHNLNINLYDYIENDTLIGSTRDNYMYLVLFKDGKYIDYDELNKKS